MEIKKCLICGKEFETNNKKQCYCSRYHDIQCPVCGKMFSCRSITIYNSRQNNIRITCSRNCAKRPTGSLLNKQPTKINFKNCEVCGKEFITNHSKKKKYCSTTHKIKCDICGNITTEISKNISKNFICKVCNNKINFLKKDLYSNNEISLCGFNYRNLPTEKELEYYNSLTSKEKAEYTSMKHYGTKHPSQSLEIKEKIVSTTIEHYGNIGFASKEIIEKYHKTCLDKYGTEWASQSEEIKNKTKQTNLERYGTENIYSSEYGKEKIKQTNLEKYGVEYSFQADEVKEKIKETNLERYGVKNPTQSPIIQEKIKQTNLEKYNVENVFQNEEIKEKIKSKQNLLYGGIGLQSDVISKKIEQTNLLKYGTTHSMKATIDTLPINSNVEILPINKCYNTKKENKTFNTSKIEKELEVKLKELFPDLETQYKSEVYHFACDYYVPSLDLYIEYNGTWTHGGHFFDKNNQDDLNKLEKWKNKNTKYYQRAIDTWTQRDILKLNTALENNLNYVAWFNKEQAYDWINAYKKSRTN